MGGIDPLGVRYKAAESAMRAVLDQDGLFGIRLDGKAFHNFTKQYARPYDTRFMDVMDATAIGIIEKSLTGVHFAYVQSDEITIFFSRSNVKAALPYGGKVEKLLSICAATATGVFMKAQPDCDGIPVFDARLFALTDAADLAGYLDWRRLDARKNAITMAASTLASHKQLHGVTTKERAALLAGTDLETLPEGFFNGRLIVRQTYTDVVEVPVKGGGTREQEVTRFTWVSVPALRETADAMAAAVTPVVATA